jgi:hypothetical protein
MSNLTRVERGDASEARVLTELLERGYSVSQPFGDNQRYDLITDDGEDLHRIQVKTGKMKDDYIEFKLTSNRSHASGVEHKPYSSEEIDAFVVYCPDNEGIYWVPVEETGTSAMRLRLDSKQEQPAINWASEYEM